VHPPKGSWRTERPCRIRLVGQVRRHSANVHHSDNVYCCSRCLCSTGNSVTDSLLQCAPNYNIVPFLTAASYGDANGDDDSGSSESNDDGEDDSSNGDGDNGGDDSFFEGDHGSSGGDSSSSSGYDQDDAGYDSSGKQAQIRSTPRFKAKRRMMPMSPLSPAAKAAKTQKTKKSSAALKTAGKTKKDTAVGLASVPTVKQQPAAANTTRHTARPAACRRSSRFNTRAC